MKECKSSADEAIMSQPSTATSSAAVAAKQTTETEANDDKHMEGGFVKTENLNDNKFDDSCFKAPLPPQKKNAFVCPSKKRSSNAKSTMLISTLKTTDSGVDSGDESEKLFGSEKSVSSSMLQLSIDGADEPLIGENSRSDDEVTGKSNKSNKENSGLVRSSGGVCVNIGKDSYLCPRSQQYFDAEFPGLDEKRRLCSLSLFSSPKQLDDNKDDEMFLNEVIIDGFSLLLFKSAKDYSILKEHEKELKEIEEKQRVYENNLRLEKLKKKNRKNKTESDKAMRKEKRELKKQEHLERREARRMRKETKEQLARERQERRDRLQQLPAEERLAQKRREKRERRDAVAALSLNNVASTSTDVFVDMSTSLTDITLAMKASNDSVSSSLSKLSSKEKSAGELRHIKREKRLLQMKQRLKTSDLSKNSINNNNFEHDAFVASSREEDAAGGGLKDALNATIAARMTASIIATDFGAVNGLVMTAEPISKLSEAANKKDSSEKNQPLTTSSSTSAAPVVFGSCSTTASTSTSVVGFTTASNLPMMTAENSLLSNPHALKHSFSASLPSAIGIAQLNGIVCAPMGLTNGLENGRNGIILSNGTPTTELQPPNKIRKLETGINDFINAHHQHSSSGVSGARLSSSNSSHPYNNLLAKSEIKMENGFTSKCVAVNNLSNSTANSQRSTPLSKGTPQSLADAVVGNSASSSAGPQLQLLTSSLLPPHSAATLSQQQIPHAKMPLSLGAVDASMAAVIQQLFGGGATSAAEGNVGDVNNAAVNAATANLLQQNVLLGLNQECLLNAANQQQQMQQQKSSQRNKAPQQQQSSNILDNNLLAAAMAINSGFPIYGIQQQLLQQQKQQLEQSQKQRLLSNTQQRSTDTALPSQFSSTTALSNKLNGVPVPSTASLLSAGLPSQLFDPSGNISLASLANAAMLGKAPVLHNSVSTSTAQPFKTERWSGRHVQIANLIARDLEKNKTITPSLQQQQNLQQQHILQQRFLQQQQQQLSMAFLPGNSRQIPTSENAASAAAAALATMTPSRKRTEPTDSNPQSQQQKRSNAGGPAAMMGFTKQQQEQHRQQVLQMAALKKQQMDAQQQNYPQALQQQQQQIQMETLRRLQQQQNSSPAQNQQQNLLAQFHQQQLHAQQQQQKLKMTPSSANNTPTSAATGPPKQLPQQQQPQQQSTLSNGIGGESTAAAAAASHLLLQQPASYLNTSLFYPGALKLPPTPTSSHTSLLINNTTTNELSQQQQQQKQHVLATQHQQKLSSQQLLNHQTASQNIMASVSDNFSQLTQQKLNYEQQQQHSANPFGFPVASQALTHNGAIGGGGGGGCLTSGTSAQANAAAAAAALAAAAGGDSTIAAQQLNSLLGLQQAAATPQQSSAQTQNAVINNPVLAQMAMTQLMMQQFGGANTIVPSSSVPSVVNGFNSLLPLQLSQQLPSQQQQQQQQPFTANQFLASLGIMSNPGTPSTTAQNITAPHSQQQQQQVQRVGISTTTTVNLQPSVIAGATVASVTPASGNTSASAATLQQQQDLLLQAALLHGIQSLEAKQLSFATHSSGTVGGQIQTATTTTTTAPLAYGITDAERLRQQQQLLADQLHHHNRQQQQQLMLERMNGHTFC